MRKFIITESQLKNLIHVLGEEICSMPGPQNPSAKKANKPYSINPEKVKIVRDFLDKNYKKANMVKVGPNGMQKNERIVGLLDTDSGNVLQTMYLDDLKDQLVTNFQNMFTDAIERELFMDKVTDAWYDNTISPLGLLQINHL